MRANDINLPEVCGWCASLSNGTCKNQSSPHYMSRMNDNNYCNQWNSAMQADFDVDRIKNCINHINTAIDVDPWAKILCEQIMSRAIPKKPYGKHTNYRCSVCNTRVRSGQGSSSRIRDTVCRKCFTVIDWSDVND